MESNNKKRILELISIFRKESDIDHKLSINEIITILENRGISVANRKTLYDDIKVLSEYGYDIEYDNGYYLSESPFLLSEIKIILDSINSLKNIDNKLLKKLNEKLYSFISSDEEKLLESLSYRNKHSDKNFIHRLEDTLNALKYHQTIVIKRQNKEEEICPLFLYRANDYYYLYYHYLDSDKIYHYRFDNIIDTKMTDNHDTLSISKARIIDTINESTNAFYSSKAEVIQIKILNDNNNLRNRLLDDFPNAIFTKDGLSLKASINNVFFSKLVAYGTDIKISDRKVADQYKKYLKAIIDN